MRSINKKFLVFVAILLIASNMVCFGEAGFSERARDYYEWVFPAYKYTLIFCVGTLALLSVPALIWRKKINSLLETVSSYLKTHPFLAIIITGLLLVVPCDAISLISYTVLWILVALAIVPLMIAYPLVISNRSIRNKWLLTPIFLKWSFLFSISAIIATLLFIYFTNLGLLSGTAATFTGLNFREDIIREFTLTHPKDSIRDMWIDCLTILEEIPIALILYIIGVIYRYIKSTIRKFKNRNQDSLPDDFDDLPEID